MLEKLSNGEWQRPRTRNDLIERLMKFEWGTQLNILAYMRRFQTWDALYEDLRMREEKNGIDSVTVYHTSDSVHFTEFGTWPREPEPRNVTPEKPKQLEGATLRELTTHIVDGDSANHQLKIEVLDEPGAGGACHLYRISGFDTKTNPSDPFKETFGQPATDARRLFQNGPIKEVGVNGTTQEAELAILIDRMECFQAGPYANNDNEQALFHLRGALECLQRRTKERMKRGVEGTHTK
jgi:hypothetical protein